MAENKKHTLSVVRVKLVPDIPLYSEEEVTTNAIASRILQEELMTYDREVFGVLNLNAKMQPISFTIASIGTMTASLVHPREVFKAAILSNAHAFIAFHNHPSGSVEPSDDDVHTTHELYEAGKLLGIQMFDHIIVGNGKSYSFSEHGLLKLPVNEALTKVQALKEVTF